MAAVEQPPPAPVVAEAPRRGERPIWDAFVQLGTITVGVLIALFFEGLVGWNQDRALVRQARLMIEREIASNKKEVDGELATLNDRIKHLDSALRMTNDLLSTGTSSINRLDLSVSLAELQAVSWRTAERTGALGHMRYDEVQESSRLYDFQEIYTSHQRGAMQRLSQAVSIFAGGDPHRAPPGDLEAFRGHIRELRGSVMLEEQFLKRLSELYAQMLKRRQGGS